MARFKATSFAILPLAVFAASLVATLGATWQTARAANARADARLRAAAAEVTAAIESKLETYLVLVRSTAGLFVGSEHVTPDEFAGFVNHMRISERYQGVRSLGFAPRVPADRASLVRVEQALSQLHDRRVRIWPPPSVVRREEHFPIAITVPAGVPKELAIGFDLGREVVRLRMLQHARDSGRTTISGPIDIVEELPDEDSPRRGFLMAVPLYAPEGVTWDRLLGGPALWPPPESIEARRQQLAGVVVGAFMIEEMMEGIRIGRAADSPPFAIYEGDELTPASRLFPRPLPFDPDDAALQEQIDLAGRTWTLLFFDPLRPEGWLAYLGLASRAYPEARLVPLVFLTGAAFSTVLLLVITAQLRARHAAEAAADIARRERAAAAESEARFRRIADAAPVMIWLADPDGQTTWHNLASLEFTGLGLESVRGTGWSSIVHPDDLQRAQDTYRHAVAAQAAYTTEVRVRRADGELRSLFITARPLFTTDGKSEIAGYVGTAVDVTDQKNALERERAHAAEQGQFATYLETLNRELARSNADLTDFASIAAHDLKEPVRGMGNFARFVREDHGASIPQQGCDMLETIERLSERLTQLLDALLEYARVGRGQLQLQKTDLNEICRQATEALSSQISSPDVELECRPLPTLNCDPVLVRQVFTNLIANGLKYNTSTPSKPRRVEIGTLATAPQRGAGGPLGEPILYVRDNGIGIAPQHHNRIFKMFKRLHTREAFGGGLGAGLAIVKKIIERHGGRIWIASELGKGTTVYFTLTPAPVPAAPPAPASHDGDEPIQEPASPAAQAEHQAHAQ